METEFKYVETSTVTDTRLSEIVNEWTALGWTYDGMTLAMRESSKRPAMAFLLFTRGRTPPDQGRPEG